MKKPLIAVCVLLLTGCAGNKSAEGTYLPRNGDDGRFIVLGDSGQALVHAQGRLIRTPYVIDGTRLLFTAFGSSAQGELRDGCIEFAAASYCRRHFVHFDRSATNP